jgi:tryptophan synthase beta chain
LECFEAGVLFARTEGIVPPPEANHAIAQTVREALQAKKEGKSKTILFNFCGHGHFDMQAYEDYFAGRLQDHSLEQDMIDQSIESIAGLQPA